MEDKPPPRPTRIWGRTQVFRAFIILPILAMAAAFYWFVLPSVQSFVLPDMAGGESGPWLVRPIIALRFGAVAVLTAVTFPVFLHPLRKVWAAEDAESGKQFDPLHGRSAKRFGMILKGSLLLIVYAFALVFYLFSWTVIKPDGIEQRLPWTTINHSFQDIASMETIPDGERSESLARNGPWFSIRVNGRSISLGLDNEEIAPDELDAMTAFISDRAGRPWVRRKDSRPR